MMAVTVSFIFSLLLHLSPVASAILATEALLQLKESFINTTALQSWQPGPSPCDQNHSWVGVMCFNGTITGIHLGSMGLKGEIDVTALGNLPGLRTLSFINNAFSGPMPEFNRLEKLNAIYLSANQFSGEIPDGYFEKMALLRKVWLSNNSFSGTIPSSLSRLPRLRELHLEHNQFTGTIPSIAQTSLESLNFSYNKLEGKIPDSLSKFHDNSFMSNPGLCGEQVRKACEQAPEQPSLAQPMPRLAKGEGKSSKMAVILLSVAAVIFALMLVTIFVMRRRGEKKFDVLEKENFEDSVEVHVSGSSRKETDSSGKHLGLSHRGTTSHSKGNGAASELVMVNDKKGVFVLPELMKAAAEVLGTGCLGSSYKALMSNGVEVVVKRMKGMNAMGMDEFDTKMRMLGKLQHRNVLTPLAYHHRKDEKLLIHEYMPKGSLLYLLHGDRGPSHGELDWPIRLKIVRGIARGLNHLHTKLASFDLPHGNLKSSNVLLNSDYEPLFVDYGFSPLLSITQATQSLFAYKSPEAKQSQHQVSPKCDVYCLGVVILEILSGKFPSQYLSNGKGGIDVVQWAATAISEGKSEEFYDPEIASSRDSLGEMERLLHVGAACTVSDPERRLGMREAIQRIEDIHVDTQQNQLIYL